MKKTTEPQERMTKYDMMIITTKKGEKKFLHEEDENLVNLASKEKV